MSKEEVRGRSALFSTNEGEHAPTRVHEVILVREGSALEVENSATLAYIAQYGAEKVRGGSYARV